MSSWSQDDLRKISAADDLHISPLRGDGVTYLSPMTGTRARSATIRILSRPGGD